MTTQKGETVLVIISHDVYHKLRLKAARDDRTLKATVDRLLRRDLNMR